MKSLSPAVITSPSRRSDPPDPQAVDLGPVGASQIDQMAERGLVVHLEMLARKHQVLRHGKVHARRPPDRERIRRSIMVFLSGMRA